MVKTLNTEFPVEHSSDNVNIIYVESLNNVYKDLYHATTNGEKSVLKAIEEGNGFIVASTDLTVEGETTKQLVRVEESKQPKVCLNDSLFSVIEEANKAAKEKVIEEKKAAKKAKTEAVTNLIVGALDEQVEAVQAKARLDFDKVVEESKKKAEETKQIQMKSKLDFDKVIEESKKKPAAVKKEVKKVKEVKEVVVEKAEQKPEQIEEKIAETSKYIQQQIMEDYDPEKGDKDFQGDMKALKSELESKINNLFQNQTRDIRKIAEMSSGGGGNESRSIQNASDIAVLSADVGAFTNVTQSQRDEFQGYIALLSPVYFGGSATTFDIPLESVNTYLDVELDVYNPGGEFDYRVSDMKDAQASGYTGTGATGDPIVFDLEGLEITSTANVRVSMSFDPDDDGGRLDSRLLFNRHSGIPLSGTDFSIEASAIAMESGADEDYAYTPSIQFFVGDTIDTNGPGDAGKVRFQIKSDVPGTVTMNEIAMFIQK